jgi:hypothetical protein
MSSETDANIALHGRVVSSVDGRPVRAALVQLMGTTPRAVLTGADGSFRFEELAAGEVVVTARKPGFFSPQEYYPESVGEQRVHLTENLQPIELKLYPESVIFGRVTNESGRPLESLSIQLRREGGSNPGQMRGELPSTTTNENGEYRIAELRAGTYVVCVSQNAEPESLPLLLHSSRIRTGYPTYFYPGVTDPSVATPLRLTPGRQFQADLRLSPQPLYRVSGNVQGASATGPVIVAVGGMHDTRPIAVSMVTAGFTGFSVDGVPAGSYFVAAIQPSQGGEGGERGMKIGVSRVEVTQDVDSVSIALSEEMKVAVRFHNEFTHTSENSPGQPPAFVTLTRTDLPIDNSPSVANLMSRPESPETGYDVSLSPGVYRATVIGQANRCVASVKSGTTDLLREELTVTAGDAVEPIEVEVRDDCGRVQGIVSKDGNPTVGRVLLIPEEAPRRGVSAPANSDGVFQFQGLVPGRYFAVALDGADDLVPDEAETFAKVKSRATTLEVGPSGSANLTLELKSMEP